MEIDLLQVDNKKIVRGLKKAARAADTEEDFKIGAIQAPFERAPQTIVKLLEALRGLYKKPLDAEYLIKDFGLESNTGKEAGNARLFRH